MECQPAGEPVESAVVALIKKRGFSLVWQGCYFQRETELAIGCPVRDDPCVKSRLAILSARGFISDQKQPLSL
jgi:hypothetical protein